VDGPNGLSDSVTDDVLILDEVGRQGIELRLALALRERALGRLTQRDDALRHRVGEVSGVLDHLVQLEVKAAEASTHRIPMSLLRLQRPIDQIGQNLLEVLRGDLCVGAVDRGSFEWHLHETFVLSLLDFSIVFFLVTEEWARPMPAPLAGSESPERVATPAGSARRRTGVKIPRSTAQSRASDHT